MIKNKLFLFLLLCSFGFSSCEDFFSINKEDLLTDEDNYKERNQIYSGMVGLATNFRDVMDDYIILSELRGDLLQPTSTAPDEYWDIFRYKTNESNLAASPAPLYLLIANCNDFLRNIRIYHDTYPGALQEVTYRGMVASTITYRAWAYLNIGKLYGEAFYHDLSVSDMNQDMATGELLQLKPLVRQLITSLQSGVDNINAFNYLDWKLIVMDPSEEENKFDQNWSRIVVNPDALLTELYLWDGNYTDAARQGILTIKGQGLYTAGTNTDLFNLSKTIIWKTLFSEGVVSEGTRNEALTVAQFDYSKRQTHDLQYYFSNYAPNIYRFKPTDYAVNRLFRVPFHVIYEEEENLEEGQKDVILGYMTTNDHQRQEASIDFENGQYVVNKYTIEGFNDKRKSYEHDAPIFVYRTSEMFLMVAEALNAIGAEGNRAADSLVSVGLASSWVGSNLTFKAPFDTPIYAGTHLSASKGVLGRLGHIGNFTRYYTPKYNNLNAVDSLARNQFVMDSIIVEETGRELAYEGKRWFTMVRMALNSNMPEKVSEIVVNKFPVGSRDHYKVWLNEPSNWFIKWNHYPDGVTPKEEGVKN